jgi:hypothetical protein
MNYELLTVLTVLTDIFLSPANEVFN